jgi:hypothetical protein
VKAAQDTSYLKELQAADAAGAGAAAAAAGSGADGSSGGERVVASVNKHAQQLQSVSQAAAGSLVLTILLARAATPLLQWMQTELKQLAPAAAAGGGGSSSSSRAGDVVLPLTSAADIWACMHFVCNVWQAVCARYMLSQVRFRPWSKRETKLHGQ